jgi:hypothetical protein
MGRRQEVSWFLALLAMGREHPKHSRKCGSSIDRIVPQGYLGPSYKSQSLTNGLEGQPGFTGRVVRNFFPSLDAHPWCALRRGSAFLCAFKANRFTEFAGEYVRFLTFIRGSNE